MSDDIPSAAILSEHTVITDHRVRDHTDTGSVKGVRRSDRGQMAVPVTSFVSDHTVVTDHRDTDHIVTRNGKARKAWMVSNDNRGGAREHSRTQPSSAQPRLQPSLDLDSDNLALYNMGGWPQAVSMGLTHAVAAFMLANLRHHQLPPTEGT